MKPVHASSVKYEPGSPDELLDPGNFNGLAIVVRSMYEIISEMFRDRPDFSLMIHLSQRDRLKT